MATTFLDTFTGAPLSFLEAHVSESGQAWNVLSSYKYKIAADGSGVRSANSNLNYAWPGEVLFGPLTYIQADFTLPNDFAATTTFKIGVRDVVGYNTPVYIDVVYLGGTSTLRTVDPVNGVVVVHSVSGRFPAESTLRITDGFAEFNGVAFPICGFTHGLPVCICMYDANSGQPGGSSETARIVLTRLEVGENTPPPVPAFRTGFKVAHESL